MTEHTISFSLEEMKHIGSTIYRLYDNTLSLREVMDIFMKELGEQIYFDKRDFTFFNYNSDTNTYEVSSFFPANWTDSEKEQYIESYIHIDDVLPILSKPQEVAFRNNDIFSEGRKQTKYYREFIQTAQLEISIDANIPLSEDCGVFAIFALYRNSDRHEFSLKDLEIVKFYQKHLSRIFENHLLTHPLNPDDESSITLENFESVGLCILDANFKFTSYNTFFKNFIPDHTSSLQDSAIGLKIIKMARELSDIPEKTKLDPISINIDDSTFLLELSRYQQNNRKYVGIIYPLSQFVSSQIDSLKDTYQLSSREFEILNLILKKGMTNDEIANYLFISPATVKRHISNAYLKLGINNQKQLLGLLKII